MISRFNLELYKMVTLLCWSLKEQGSVQMKRNSSVVLLDPNLYIQATFLSTLMSVT